MDFTEPVEFEMKIIEISLDMNYVLKLLYATVYVSIMISTKFRSHWLSG